MRAAGGGFGHGAEPTVATGLVHIQKGDGLPHLKGPAMEIYRPALDLGNLAHVHMARDDGIGHAAQVPMVQVHIRAAHLAVKGAQEDGALFQGGQRILPHLHRHFGGLHHRRSDHGGLL